MNRSALRLIALFKLVQGLLLLGVSFGFFRLIHADLDQVAVNFLSLIRLDADTELNQKLIGYFTRLSPTEIARLSLVALLYSLLLLGEGLGLWWRKQWAEYLVIVGTSISLPVEIYHIWHHPGPLKLGLLAINLIIVAYLVRVVRQGKRGQGLKTGG